MLKPRGRRCPMADEWQGRNVSGARSLPRMDMVINTHQCAVGAGASVFRRLFGGENCQRRVAGSEIRLLMLR